MDPIERQKHELKQALIDIFGATPIGETMGDMLRQGLTPAQPRSQSIMTLAELQASLRANACTVKVIPDGRLAVSPKGRITPEVDAAIRTHKAAIVALLQAQPPANDVPTWQGVTPRKARQNPRYTYG